MQQIRDWKRYLINNKNDFKKIFPTTSTKVVKDNKLRYKIVIGRRNDNQEHVEKRKQIEEQENVEIVSFDRLTDLARSRRYFSDVAQIYAPQMDSHAYELRKELANPFYECINDSKWRLICRKGHSHIYSNMIKDILMVRTYNEYMEEYKKWLIKGK